MCMGNTYKVFTFLQGVPVSIAYICSVTCKLVQLYNQVGSIVQLKHKQLYFFF